jgi:hypothetical protein|tara:strand:- start:7348 stop:7620 length:273 start_codon:yes stop_codon:yes gene_type:complete
MFAVVIAEEAFNSLSFDCSIPAFFWRKNMTIDKREAKALVNVIESLLDSLDKTFDSLPANIDQRVKDAKLTLLNVNIENERQRKFLRIFR